MKDNRQRLFEMMHRVGGMPIIKESGANNSLDGLTLPPGFTSDDFFTNGEMNDMDCGATIEEVKKKREKKPKKVKPPTIYGSVGNTEPTPMEGVNSKKLNREDLINALNFKTSNILAGLPQGGKDDLGRIDTTTLKKFKFGDEGEAEKSLKQLSDLLMIVPTDEQLLGKNTKMGKSNYYNITLPALMALIYNQKNGEFYALTTCPNADECKLWCYAQMGNYIKSNPAVRLNMQKLNYLFNHYDEWKNRVISRIEEMSKTQDFTVRWHDAGDFLSEKYLDLAIEIANATPYIKHYAYTKMVDLVKSKTLPSNFQIRFSFGGTQDVSGDTSNTKYGIDRASDYHADTVPKDIFKKYQPTRKNKFLDKEKNIPNPEYSKGQIWKISPENMKLLKQDIMAKYGFDNQEFENRVLTHDEYMKLYNNSNYDEKKNYKKWIVINKMGDTDIPANQYDVLGVYNLQHN